MRLKRYDDVSCIDFKMVAKYPELSKLIFSNNNLSDYTVDDFVREPALLLEAPFQKEEFYLEVIKRNPFAIRYIEYYSKEVALTALRLNGNTILFIRSNDWCYSLYCMEAVKCTPSAIQYIEKPSEDACLTAVRQNGKVLQFIKNQTKNVCLEAVKQNGHALEFVLNQDKEICTVAVKKTPNAIKHIRDKNLQFEISSEL